jgi:hypothetical protein
LGYLLFQVLGYLARRVADVLIVREQHLWHFFGSRTMISLNGARREFPNLVSMAVHYVLVSHNVEIRAVRLCAMLAAI